MEATIGRRTCGKHRPDRMMFATRTRWDRTQTDTETGEVAIQTAVQRKTAQPMASIATRSLGDVSLVLMPAKNSAEANRTTPST